MPKKPNYEKRHFAQRNVAHPSEPRFFDSQPSNQAIRQTTLQKDHDRIFRAGSVIVSSGFGFQPNIVYTNSKGGGCADNLETIDYTNNVSSAGSEEKEDEFSLFQTASMFGNMRKKRLPWIPKIDPTAPKSRFAVSDEEQALLAPKVVEGGPGGNKKNKGHRVANGGNPSTTCGEQAISAKDGNDNTSSGDQAESGNNTDEKLLYFSPFAGISEPISQDIRDITQSFEEGVKLPPLVHCKELYGLMANAVAVCSTVKEKQPEVHAQMLEIVKRGRPD